MNKQIIGNGDAECSDVLPIGEDPVGNIDNAPIGDSNLGDGKNPPVGNGVIPCTITPPIGSGDSEIPVGEHSEEFSNEFN